MSVQMAFGEVDVSGGSCLPNLAVVVVEVWEVLWNVCWKMIQGRREMLGPKRPESVWLRLRLEWPVADHLRVLPLLHLQTSTFDFEKHTPTCMLASRHQSSTRFDW